MENEMNKRCFDIIKKLNLNPRIVTHRPILNYETAEEVDKELNLTGEETKTLFLKSKANNYYLFITLATERMNSKQIKNILGEKVNLVSGEEMISLTSMQPGCMTPFGLKENLIMAIIVDPKIYNFDKLICAFGSETMSMEIKSEDLKKILEYSYKTIYTLN